ncbi:MAG TPA: FAD-dependent oxidoreductase [Gaiellaceae bacterium]|nr:FAD-dependent oxidoreductase [Gaiellaceae bacterium]
MRRYDVVVVGSGFGGSVAALRLTEKGYRVGVLEAGRRFGAEDFPRTSWDVRRYLWAPRAGCRGILRLTRLRHAFVLSGAGVGGGSLVYANVLAQPSDPDPALAPHYETVRAMLGATAVPFETPADAVLRRVAERMGAAGTFRPTDVAVDFDRCVHCGGCMIGCRHGAKNTLDRTYLRLAERGGAVVHAEHEARLVRRAGAEWETVTPRGLFRSQHVVLAAGVLGTLPLLFRLPAPPPMVGRNVRTNTETLVGASADRPGTDYSHGVAITSSIEPAPGVVIQPVRYPRGSNAMALLGRPLSVRRWAERTVILLCMGKGEDSLRLRWSGGKLRSEREPGAAPPVEVGEATRAAEIAAEEMAGRPGRFRLDLPVTAHILGGAVRGDSPAAGVVDGHHRVFGHPGLHVVDGAAVGRNLGVNPALTIAAQAELAMTAWPRKGEPDQRPSTLGS